METRIKDVVSSLGTGFDDLRMIRINGMGGGGKTTLARVVFDQISFQFKGKSFVENVREVSNASLFGLKSLQKQVLRDVLNDKGIRVSSVYDGKHMIKRMVHDKRVLVVLDDVDNVDQLEELVGDPNWYAFGRDIPIQGYDNLTREVVRYASGLLLTLRVLSSFLCGRNELEWIDAVKRLQMIPLTETLKKLELSYIGLEEDYKEIFLDVACILKGRTKEVTIKVLESCGFHARNGLRVLEQKSLITISNYNLCVGMHDHIEEMGRNIVRRMYSDKPYKHSRLWISDESKIYWLTICPEIPKALRYLDLKHYPFSSLPKTFQADNLITLEMVDCKILQLWEGGERK
uniref:NB-ARC domain-containing protein n=1 Tax=Lactuca sativa TaxID=4236 RepID=A0A9R1VY18_LACSA|nr:hypothetical protein LSAT_V11C400215830 [Lactuca sativa]